MIIRPARPEDKAAIAAFTTDTFSWGDYVADVFDSWLENPHGQMLVAENQSGDVIGMARVSMLSASEAWIQAARVHSDHRRQGVGGRLTHAGEAWAVERGALVIRLLTEDWNEAAQRQVEKSAFRLVARWAMAQKSVGRSIPAIPGNGGRRAPAEERLRPASVHEAEPAYLAWSTGDLITAGHGLFPAIGWMWRQMTLEDVTRAARSRTLWDCPAGWLIGRIEDDMFWVPWVVAGPEDAYRLVRAAIDLAEEQGAERLRMLLPHTDWLLQAVHRAGLEVRPSLLYAKTLQ
ncbi:MAG: N-acetyltransferase family protein [Acidimicrobiia bacterium]